MSIIRNKRPLALSSSRPPQDPGADAPGARRLASVAAVVTAGPAQALDPASSSVCSSGPGPLRSGAALSLAQLNRGQLARVLDLGEASGLRHRLQALGLRPGQRIQVLRRAPWGGPLHLQVGMTELMLRRRDAARIAVVPLPLRP